MNQTLRHFAEALRGVCPLVAGHPPQEGDHQHLDEIGARAGRTSNKGGTMNTPYLRVVR